MRNIQPSPKKLQILICLLISIPLTIVSYSAATGNLAGMEPGSANAITISMGGNGIIPVSFDFPGLDEKQDKKIITTMSPTNMNVLYAEIYNPVSAAVSGVDADKVHLYSTGATITGEMGNYKLLVSPGAEEISVLATSKENGEGEVYGSVRFRVRTLPKPVLQLGTLNPRRMSASAEEIKAVNGVYAGMGDGFVFEGISYTITAYSIMYVPKKGTPTMFTVKGEFISPEFTKAIENLATGDQIIVYDGKAKGTSGQEFLLTTSVIVTVQ